MHPFVRNLITEWRRLELPFEGETVVIAVSGGADSVSLLMAMHELKQREKLDLRLVAAHFNHRLRGAESDADEEYVRHLTSEHGIELTTAKGTISTTGNLEQNARNARYDFLKQIASNLKAFAIVTGHTINDQAETFLMNLIRGSGVEGLCGMSVIRTFEKEKRGKGEEEMSDLDDSGFSSPPLLFPSSPLLIRPLLTWAKRGDTEQYCRDLGVEYRYDTMNEDTAFKRVRIRKILLPLLQDFNPNIIETLANTAALMREPTENSKERNQTPPAGKLVLADLKTLPQPELYGKIREWLKLHRGTTRQLQLKHIQAIERLILSTKSGKTAELPGGKVTKTSGKLRYDKNKVEN